MEISSRQIADTQFTTALRGYDRDEVDRFVADCAKHTGALEERTKIAEVRTASSEKELAALKADIDVLLQEATDARHKIIEEAKAEASTISNQANAAGESSDLSDAVARAAAIITEAETAARLRLDGIEEIRKSAELEATDIIRRAEQSATMTQAEADRLLDKARLDANSIRKEATATRASMEGQLAEIRQILENARAADVDSELVIDLREDADESTPHRAAG
jgi:DivIVA domain-containing protein